MKARKFLYGAIAFMMLPACVNDMDDGTTSESETTAKIRINIVSDSGVGTRASDDFLDGTSEENAINNVTVVFYDSQKNAMQTVQVNSSDIKEAGNNESPNVEVVKSMEVNVALTNGMFPSYVMVYANPSGSLSFNMSEIATQKRTDYKSSDGKFSMSNSVYYDETSGLLQREIPVTRNNFYHSEEEKETAEAVTVYIERMAAKVKLISGSGDPDKFETTQSGVLDDKTLKFNVTSWGLNGCAKECYLSKRFDGRTFSDENDKINGSFNWNDQPNRRSYWAMSPFYDMPESNTNGNGLLYPWVSEQVSGNNKLTYHKYSEIAAADGKTGVAIGGSMYGLENTIHSSFYSASNLNSNAALVSALVIGYYTINDETVDFYVHGQNIYTKSEYLKAMAQLGSVIVKANGKPLDDTDKLSDIFEIKHPTKPIGSDESRGVEENKVTIKFINNELTRANYKFKKGSSDPVDITPNMVDEINEELQAHCGLASMYKDGKAYFNVPIRHLGKKVKEDDAWPAGSFGLVRNHAYVITVNGFAELSFATLGHGVRDPEDPIVPPSDPDDKFGIKADVKVHSWRVINQNVTLGEKK